MKKIATFTMLSTLLLGSTGHAEEYSLMVYETKAELAARTDSQKSDDYWGVYNAFAEELVKAGVMRGGSAVDEKEVRVVASGKISKENPEINDSHLGGYFVIDVPNIEEAIIWAEKVPTKGFVEVRPHRSNPTMPMKK
jgi:hypothetical protein